MNAASGRIWVASECALVLIDYQPAVIDMVFEQDHRVIELNVTTLAKAAIDFNIPVVLSTVGVRLGVSTPTIERLKAALPGVDEIDRSSMNAWEEPGFVEAIRATGRAKLVMCGIMTSSCLAYAAIAALDEGFEVMFVEDAVGDQYQRKHEMAIERLMQAGAIPNSTISMISEWFRDWKSPLAPAARKHFIEHFEAMAPLKIKPERYQPKGLLGK